MALSEREELELIALLELELAEIERDKPIWTPNARKNPDEPSPQEILMSTTARVIGFGGAGGGGKTYGMVGKALLQHDSVMILRRTFSQFEEMSKNFERLAGRENVTDKGLIVKFRNPKTKHKQIKARSIKLGHLNNLKDWEIYAGNPHDLLGFDEVTGFSENIVRGLMAWNRSTIKGQLCQTLMTFNPPLTPMGLWVIAFFGPWVDENFLDHNRRPLAAKSGEILHVAYINDEDYFFREPQMLTHHPVTGKELPDAVATVSRTFIRARIEDNPHQDQAEYKSRLQGMGSEWQRAILYGEMSSSLVDQIGQIFKGDPYKECQARWKAMDIAGTLPKSIPLAVGLDTAQGGKDDNCYFPIWETGIFGTKGLIKGEGVRYKVDEMRDWMVAHNLLKEGSTEAGWLGAANAISICMWLEKEFKERWECAADEIPICVDAIGGADFLSIWCIAFPNSLVHKFRGSDGAGVTGILLPPRTTVKVEKAWNHAAQLPFYSHGVKYTNKIAAAWCRLGDATRHQEFKIAFPPDNELRRQLTSRRTNDNSQEKSRMGITPKDKFSEEIGQSPNEADAAVMAYWFIDVVLKFGLSKAEIARFEEIQRVRCS